MSPDSADSSGPTPPNHKVFANLSQDMLCAIGRDGHSHWFNPRWQQVLGWSGEELNEGTLYALIHPDDVTTTREKFTGLTGETTALSLTNRCRCKDGSWIWLQWQVQRSDDDLLYCRVHEVAAPRLKLETQRAQLKLWRLAAKMASIGYWQLDLIDDTVYWSPEIYRIHGRDAVTFVPTLDKGIEAYHEDDRERVRQCVQRAIRFREPFDFRLRIVQPNGDIRWVHSIGRCQEDANRVPVQLFGVFRDISADAQLQTMNNKLRGFTHMVSHDLKEPARTVAAYVELLQEDYSQRLDESAQGYLRHIDGAAKRMQVQIDALRRYAELAESGRFEQVALDDVVTDVLRRMDERLRAANARLDVEPLPAVVGDPARLGEVFQNLICNAIKFTEEEAPRVQIASARKGSLVEISVRDHGIGIEPEYRKKVFGPFQRLHPRDAYEGTGVGLSIVQRIVEAAGGKVGIRTPEDGVGTTMWFSAPAASG